jgi:hypothetical protein
MTMSHDRADETGRGTEPEPNPAEVRRYVSAVDNMLLDRGWVGLLLCNDDLIRYRSTKPSRTVTGASLLASYRWGVSPEPG